MDEAAAQEYRTWSGSVRFTPGRHLEPADEGELARIIGRAREHGHTVRPRGSGHSSTPLIASDDVLRALAATGLPMSLVSHSVADSSIPSVIPDNENGIRQLTSHVIGDCGRRR